jgi:hypothetical protein
MDPDDGSTPLALRLDLTDGDVLRSKVQQRFSSSVCPSSPSSGFSLVVSFGRANFNLDVNTVGLALSACLGDPYNSFRVSLIRDQVFIFDVCSKAVGFLICNLRSYKCKDFVCYFHLWSNGGPNWQREEQIWIYEQEKEWTTIHRKSPRSNLRRVRGFIRWEYRIKSNASTRNQTFGRKDNIDTSLPIQGNFVPSVSNDMFCNVDRDLRRSPTHSGNSNLNSSSPIGPDMLHSQIPT